MYTSCVNLCVYTFLVLATSWQILRYARTFPGQSDEFSYFFFFSISLCVLFTLIIINFAESRSGRSARPMIYKTRTRICDGVVISPSSWFPSFRLRAPKSAAAVVYERAMYYIRIILSRGAVRADVGANKSSDGAKQGEGEKKGY